MSRQMGKLLVEAGVLTPQLLEQALQRQKTTGQKLGECLVRLGLDETPVLRLLAQQFGTRFVSTAKLAQARLEPSVIERVPVRLAEGFDFVPIRLDGDSLYVAMAEPQRVKALEEIARAVGVEHVVPFVAIRRSVRAAIRKAYYSDPNAFETTSDDDTCPHCGAPVNPTDFQCSRCELLLVRHADELPQRDNVSLVRALLTEPDGSHGRRPLERPNQERTAVYALAPQVPSGRLVPIIIASFDLVEKPLTPFEAFVLSYVDGRTTLAEMAQLTQLKDVELRALFESLVERGVVDVSDPNAPPAPAPPAPSGPPQMLPFDSPLDSPRAGPPSGSHKASPASREKAAPPAPPTTQAVLVGPPTGPRKAASPLPPEKPAPPVPERTPPPAPERSAPPPLPPGVAITRSAAQKLVLEKAAKAREESAADGILQRVVALERGGKVTEAIDLLTQSIGTLRNPAPLYNRLGLILLDQYRDYERATELLKKATELDPDTSVYMMNLYAVLSMKAEATDPGNKKKGKPARAK